MFVSPISSVNQISVKQMKNNFSPSFMSKLDDVFDSQNKNKIIISKNKNGDLKTIAEYNEDNLLIRKGRMVENKYGVQKLLVDYPNSKENKKELYVIDSYLKASYKLTKEDSAENPKNINISHYSKRYTEEKITGFPDDSFDNLVCDFSVNKNTHKINEYNLYNNKTPLMTIKIDRDDKNRMVYNTMISGENKSVTNVKYLEDKTLYHFSNKYFDELMVTPKDSIDEQHTITILKNPVGRIAKTELNYFEDEQLDYTEYDSKDNVIVLAIGDPETKEVISYKEFDKNGLIKDEYEKKFFDSYEHREYENGVLKNKSEVEYPPYEFKDDISVLNEENLMSGIVSSYKIDNIFPIKY